MKKNYQGTIYACFVAYVVQAIVNNFAPLLFVTFETSYRIPLTKITLLITVNFIVQLLVDALSAGLIDRLGCRVSMIAAHLFAVAGLTSLTFLPELMPDPFAGLFISVCLYAVGGGLIEVLVSPIIEACPTDNKEKAMSLLHSFYCWGHVGVVLLSTVFFAAFGIGAWRILGVIWALIPAANTIFFFKVPLAPLNPPGEKGLTVRNLIHDKLFWVLLLMMLCAGASEQSVSQWASVLAEKGLGVSKTVGDLAGPMAFATLMGISRLIYGKFGDRIELDKYMTFSCIACIASYLCIALVPVPFFRLLGCAVCGFALGIFWPGTLSRASALIRGGGTAMFALLALAGDLGCSAGPTFAGLVSGLSGNDLKAGILAATVFPIVLYTAAILLKRRNP